MSMLIKTFCSALLIVAASPVHAENFGLRDRQPANQLPKSKAGRVAPVRKSQAEAPPVADRLIRIGGEEWRITGGWKLIEAEAVFPAPVQLFDPAFDPAGWHDAVVPGTVLTSLLGQGIYADPYYSVNNLAIPDDLCRKEWIYRVVFDRPQTAGEHHVWLLLNGVNYRVSVFLNGVRLGAVSGAFTRVRFDVTSFLKPVGNVLLVRVMPPPQSGYPA